MPITYFLFYILTRFFAPYLVSLGLGIIFFLLAKKHNVSKQNSLLYSEELWIMTLALFLVGWPGVLFYGIIFLFVFLFASVINTARYGALYRTTPYYLWIPTAILVILCSELYLKDTTLWLLLKI